MLIMNQQKTALLNINHIKTIDASPLYLAVGDKPDNRADVQAVDQAGTILPLGRYATLDRAKAVLLEIAQEYGKYLSVSGGPCLTVETYVQPMAFEPPKVYMMPEE